MFFMGQLLVHLMQSALQLYSLFLESLSGPLQITFHHLLSLLKVLAEHIRKGKYSVSVILVLVCECVILHETGLALTC